MVIGLIICTAFGFSCGWMACSHLLKHAERRSDKRCNKTTLKRAYKTKIETDKIIEPMKDTTQQNLDYFFYYLNMGKDLEPKNNNNAK